MIFSYVPSRQWYRVLTMSRGWKSQVRALWLNLTGLSDFQKAEIVDVACDPTKGLFGPGLEKMKAKSTHRMEKHWASDYHTNPKLLPPTYFTVVSGGFLTNGVKLGPLFLSSVQWWRCFIFHKLFTISFSKFWLSSGFW